MKINWPLKYAERGGLPELQDMMNRTILRPIFISGDIQYRKCMRGMFKALVQIMNDNQSLFGNFMSAELVVNPRLKELFDKSPSGKEQERHDRESNLFIEESVAVPDTKAEPTVEDVVETASESIPNPKLKSRGRPRRNRG